MTPSVGGVWIFSAKNPLGKLESFDSGMLDNKAKKGG